MLSRRLTWQQLFLQEHRLTNKQPARTPRVKRSCYQQLTNSELHSPVTIGCFTTPAPSTLHLSNPLPCPFESNLPLSAHTCTVA
jgi:hypothetical protein